MSLALFEDATDSMGGGVLFVTEDARVAEFVAGAWGLLLLLDVEGATQLGEGDGGGGHPLLRFRELVFAAEKLVLALVLRPYTSLSALQAKWNKRVIFVQSLYLRISWISWFKPATNRAIVASSLSSKLQCTMPICNSW
jgi:hypothetical protein